MKTSIKLVLLTIALMLATLSLAGCAKKVALEIYEVAREETMNDVTIGVGRVFYRPNFEDKGLGGREARLHLVGYICNYRSTPVKIYETDVGTQTAVFSWGDGETERITNLWVDGNRREGYFEVPPGTEARFALTVEDSYLNTLPGLSSGVLSLAKVEDTSGEQWSYNMDIPLGNHRVEDIPFIDLEKEYPDFQPRYEGSEPKCSPQPGS